MNALSKERLRRKYRPARVRVLFIGESPPASGRFFYQADSGLYRAMREAFIKVFPDIENKDFLLSFRELGCYLVDLCGKPVDGLATKERREACRDGEDGLAKTLSYLDPEIVVTVVRSITGNVNRSQERANWSGLHIAFPYPGRWQRHRETFLRGLAAVLKQMYGR